MFFTKENHHNLGLSNMAWLSALNPHFFREGDVEGLGSFVSGDLAAVSPALFAFDHAVSTYKVRPSEVKVVSIGSTLDLPEKESSVDKKHLLNFMGRSFNRSNHDTLL